MITIFVVLYLIVFAAIAQAQLPQIQTGINYLTSYQNADGIWTTNTAQVEITATTVSAVDALKSLNQTAGSAYTNVTAWLQNQSPISADYQAQRIHALGLIDNSINALISLLNQQEHAWGGDAGDETNSLDTASALQALKSSNYTDQTVIFGAIGYLLTTQNPDGGWGFTEDDDSTVFVTAQVLSALAQFKNTYLMDQQITNAASFLRSTIRQRGFDKKKARGNPRAFFFYWCGKSSLSQSVGGLASGGFWPLIMTGQLLVPVVSPFFKRWNAPGGW